MRLTRNHITFLGNLRKVDPRIYFGVFQITPHLRSGNFEKHQIRPQSHATTGTNCPVYFF